MFQIFSPKESSLANKTCSRVRRWVLTSVVKQHFSNDGAELLHQPDLLTYFQTRLQAMSEFNLPIVHQIQDALVEVKPLINIGNARISAESVKKVNEITTRLGNDIIKKD